MAIIPQGELFGWKEIEAASDLDRLRLVMKTIPDKELMEHLESKRGKGRDDYPIRPTWNALIAGIVFQHPSAASLRRELLRNGELRQVCGFKPYLGADAVPSDNAFSNFLKLLIDNQHMVEAMFHKLVGELLKAMPELGRRLAVDSKALESYARPVKRQDGEGEEKKEKQESEGEEEEKEEKQESEKEEEKEGQEVKKDRRREDDADTGVKTYTGIRKDGTKWEKVSSWFGFKLHLLVDSDYELPLAFEVTKASKSDTEYLVPLVKQCKEKHPDIIEGSEELAADKGYDSKENNKALYDDFGIKPIIDKRHMWKEDPEEARVLFGDRYDVFSYDDHGRVYCTCPVTSELRDMFHYGFEKKRNTLKYRCPAVAFGFECKGKAECEKLAPRGVSKEYGRIVRIPLKKDRRLFTPVARHTEKWKKAYAKRTAVERVNSRIDRILGFEQHTIRGLKKMKTRITLALIVMLSMALGRIRTNQAELMRSLTKPVKLKAA